MRLVLSLVFGLSLVACADTGYYVDTAPPPAEVEVVGTAPYSGAVWTPGYYGWEGNRHVWHGGAWARPPRPGYVYRPHRWEPRGGRYYHVRGGWGRR